MTPEERPSRVGDYAWVPNVLPPDSPGYASAEEIFSGPGRIVSIADGWAMVDLGKWGQFGRPAHTLARAAPGVPCSAVRWQNDAVMVFGPDGEQIFGLQGSYDECRDRVLAAATSRTVFQHGIWGEGKLTRVDRVEW